MLLSADTREESKALTNGNDFESEMEAARRQAMSCGQRLSVPTVGVNIEASMVGLAQDKSPNHTVASTARAKGLGENTETSNQNLHLMH